MEKITIQFYRKSNYGNDAEYILERNTALYVQSLTGRRTITKADKGNISGLIGRLTGADVEWQEVPAPKGV